MVKDFDLEQMNFGQLGLLIIRGFDNIGELSHYRTVLEADEHLQLPPQVRPVVIAAENFRLLLSQGRSFEEYFQYTGEQSLEETRAAILPPDEYVTGQEEREIFEEQQSQQPDTETAQEPEVPDTSAEAKPEAPASKPKAAHRSVPAPMPEYPSGSEGDDPLFDP